MGEEIWSEKFSLVVEIKSRKFYAVGAIRVQLGRGTGVIVIYLSGPKLPSLTMRASSKFQHTTTTQHKVPNFEVFAWVGVHASLCSPLVP